MSAVIEFEQVTKVYQDRQIGLADISFSLPSGSTIGLLGANGSGKSTAIRLALGLITPSAGTISVFGERMRPGAKNLRQRVGFLSDDPVFPKDLSAIRYLTFVGNCFGLDKRERNGRMGTLLRAVGLMDDAGRKIATYSTGMRTRLGIAASLMNDPELLIWDEPTAGLDPISRRQTLELLEQLRGQKTVLLSSHILGDIDRACDRLLILNKGQRLFEGSRSQLEGLLPKSILELSISGARERFRTAVRERLNRPDYSQDKSRVRIELSADETLEEIIGALLRLAKETDTCVEGINSTGRQLEDAYLKLITEDEFSGFLRAKK
ncbi:MAG TPA: ABC transporter ATP-binding protein [Candidatus Limnocylindrales bacterium]|jgi:ABC-2 type transport system ATP-binding protein|nr:ABC transporter ATP-binding protein [Candidatus Limnocylindrales bacterium]